MADDPNKKGADAKRVSQQPHEQAYQKRKQKESGEGSEKKASSGRSGSSKSGGKSSSGRSGKS